MQIGQLERMRAFEKFVALIVVSKILVVVTLVQQVSRLRSVGI